MGMGFRGSGPRRPSLRPKTEDPSPTVDGLVTAVEQQERRGGRRSNVYVDGRYAFSLSTELAATLHVGEAVTPARHTELVTKDQLVRCYDAALRFLGSRPRSEREIRDRLARHEFDRTVVDQVIVKLRRVRLVDDEAFAAYWVEQRTTHRPRGGRLIKQELRLKGVTQDVAAAALPDPEDEAEGAYRAAQRKAQGLRALDERTFKQRLGAFLQRRGFGYETVSSVVTRLWSEVREQ